MVSEAEKYKEEDEKQRDRVTAKNALESYAFNLKSTVEDDKVKDKISSSDRNTITQKTKETLDWLESNQVSEIIFGNNCYAYGKQFFGYEQIRASLPT